MKWNLIVSTVVLGLSMCAPSYGFDLLDRMLGVGGCGCETSCCEPSCAAPVGCCVKAPSCCEPSCCEAVPCCKPRRCGGLLSGLSLNRCCAKSSCGCEAPVGCCEKAACCEDSCCAPACKPRCRPCLLDRLFARRSCCAPSCCTVSCGCDAGCGCSVGIDKGGAPAPAFDDSEMAPMPPAPVVDPSAYVPAKRRVVHASTTLVR